MWLAVAELDTFKLVNMGPGPRQLFADMDENEQWYALMDYGTIGEPADIQDDLVYVAGPFDMESEAFSFIRAVGQGLNAVGELLIMQRNT